MKKTLKRIVLGAVFLFIVFVICFLIGRFRLYYYLETVPNRQENTMWRSEDGKICIYIDENRQGKASFEQNGGTTDCYFVSGYSYYAEVYSWEVTETNMPTEETLYERWTYKKLKKDSFTIIVEQTTFLTVGEEISFYKVLE